VLIQSLLLIATMLIVGSALLTSTLVSAKAAFHRAVIHKSETAMSDATAQFVSWAQNYVSKYGTEAPWPTGTQPQSGPISEDLCTGKVLSGNALGAPGASPSNGTCALMATMEWTVTGSSATTALRPVQTAATSTAQNLSVSLDEQRISATLTVIITNASGKTVFANHSRKLTARIFDASPYIAVTGSRDVPTEVGNIHSSEGDTGGAGRFLSSNRSVAPSPVDPSAFTDTQILTTIDCANTTTNNDQNNPEADGSSVYFDRSQRNYGNLAWAFEAPCAPTYQIDSTDAPKDYQPPQGRTYGTGAAVDRPWHKSDQNASSYSQ
jgi:hypothetical protein